MPQPILGAQPSGPFSSLELNGSALSLLATFRDIFQAFLSASAQQRRHPSFPQCDDAHLSLAQGAEHRRFLAGKLWDW